ncbi:MAG: YaiI/YqxD family protein [Ruminococcus sp.]|uniref:YaiI/YqxD family protein n=1 Tax=Ruminococcus sp. TaxID=41978 RepID=UPI0025E92D49|nr:YaiI/YqxD family protein [Ruminococcus sp.]MBO4866233.1 YaiI/YqxD family protein [Ruminococcus sp.]
MRIFIDADGCPVVKLTLEIAKKHDIPVTIVCDTAHEFSEQGAEVITVGKGADSADFALVNLMAKNDIAVTQDYGLAAMCLAKKAFAINQNGLIYDSDNIDSLLMSRHIAKKLKRSGKHLKGPAKRTAENDKDFAAALEKLIADVNRKDV